jgi:uncharacterized Zn-binding protein involved in type VI secretion
MVTVLVPHVGGPILPPGAPTVLIDFLPAATVTSMATCVGPPDVIVLGSMGVMINFFPAARLGDMTAHGGVIVMGSPTCIIGEVGSPSPGAGGMGGVVAGLAASGVTQLQQNPSVYSTAGSGAGSANVSPNPAADTPKARLEVAQAFYNQTGWSQEKIANHLRGIDFNHPVEVVTLHAGDEVKQWIDPKSGTGNYFDADARPEELGIYPASVVPRELKTFVVSKETKVLKSTAAAIRIDWLKGAPAVNVKGGAAQYFALPKDKSNFVQGGAK